MASRNLKVAEQLKKEMAQIIRDELKDPRLGDGLVTVTGVEVSNDLHHAKIFVSVYGSSEKKEQAMAALAGAKSFVRREIGRRLSLRYTPEVTFKSDASIEHGDHINRLLAKVRAEEEGNDGS